ncbi:MAG: transposase, partial [Limisphaerales bacterium]
MTLRTFGEYLDFHPHIHALVADGLFTRPVPLPTPRNSDDLPAPSTSPTRASRWCATAAGTPTKSAACASAACATTSQTPQQKVARPHPAHLARGPAPMPGLPKPHARHRRHRGPGSRPENPTPLGALARPACSQPASGQFGTLHTVPL